MPKRSDNICEKEATSVDERSCYSSNSSIYQGAETDIIGTDWNSSQAYVYSIEEKKADAAEAKEIDSLDSWIVAIGIFIISLASGLPNCWYV